MKSFHLHGNWRGALVAIAVLSAHIAAWRVLIGDSMAEPARGGGSVSNAKAAIRAYIVQEQSALDVVPMPEVELARVKFHSSELVQVRFEDAQQGDTGGVVATASAPRLTDACAQVCDPIRFAADAGLVTSQTVTVVLVIEVLANGSIGSTDVLKRSGNPAADAVAIGYAQSLHWIPGTRNHQALSMRIRLPVTFASAPSWQR